MTNSNNINLPGSANHEANLNSYIEEVLLPSLELFAGRVLSKLQAMSYEVQSEMNEAFMSIQTLSQQVDSALQQKNNSSTGGANEPMYS